MLCSAFDGKFFDNNNAKFIAEKDALFRAMNEC